MPLITIQCSALGTRAHGDAFDLVPLTHVHAVVSVPRLLPSEGHKLLGEQLAAEGPEPCAGAAAEDDGGVIDAEDKLKERLQKNVDGSCFDLRRYWRYSHSDAR